MLLIKFEQSRFDAVGATVTEKTCKLCHGIITNCRLKLNNNRLQIAKKRTLLRNIRKGFKRSMSLQKLLEVWEWVNEHFNFKATISSF